jgi:N-acetyl-anhydromuramyl-L-alanine amidase AmpD
MRIYPKVVVRHESPNHSIRDARIDGVVLHSTEGKNVHGLGDLRGLGNWFGSSASQVSAHVATDGDGLSARFVEDVLKAWHCGVYNSRKLGIEQVGQASQTTWSRAELHETARWIAYFSRKHDFPIQHSVQTGVCRHSDLGEAGGGHHDPGPHDPLDRVLKLARRYRVLQIRHRSHHR